MSSAAAATAANENADDEDSVMPTSEQARAIQLYCRQQMRLVRLAEEEGGAITKKRKEIQEARKTLRSWIQLHNDFPVADTDVEKRAYTYVTPQNEKIFLRLAKSTSQRNLNPDAINQAIRQLTSDEITKRLASIESKVKAKAKAPAAKKKKTGAAIAATTTTTTTTAAVATVAASSPLDGHVSMREAVATTLALLIRETTRTTTLNPEVTTSKPRGWGKKDPPLLPQGWIDSVKKICAVKEELQELDPPYKRKRKEISDEVEKQQEVIEEFFQKLPENNRMQPVILKPSDVQAEATITNSSGGLASGDQLQYLTMVTKAPSKKLTAANAMPAIEKAVAQVFQDAETSFTKEAFDKWRSDDANMTLFTTVVHETMQNYRTEQVQTKNSLKLSSTLKATAARAYRKGDSDDDGDEDDENDEDADDDDDDE